MSKHLILRLLPVVLLAGAPGCVPPSPPSAPSASEARAPADGSAAARSAEPGEAKPSLLTSASAVALPDSAAGRQLAAWLEAFNGRDRPALIAYHERHFPYQVASEDVSNIEREHGLSQATGGFDVRRLEQSADDHVEVVLQERHRPQHARAYLQVSPEPPHAVTRFRIGPIPTPLDLLSAEERKARTIDAELRHTAIEAIARQLQAHYVVAETAARVSTVLRKKQARGDYDARTDAIDFADALTRDLRRLARDKHLGLRFGPLPPEPSVDGPAPPWLANVGYGFGPVERLEGNVAHLVINGFPPLFEVERQAIAEHMSAIADAAAVIIDLRGNGGGFPPTVTLMASYFFDEQPVQLNRIYRRDTNHTNEQWSERVVPGQRFGVKKPVYVLTSPQTFSGGEGFAYALQAQGRALVIGQDTAGGAHPTQPYPVAGGFVLMVPWGESISPITGTNWEGIGVVPDVATPADEALETAHRLALEQLGRR
ncbi:MAG: S41 family peptidase [Deltaproteobacteria bacterium]